MCALFSIFGHEDAAHITHLCLGSLQHRGQDSVGIISTDGDDFFICKKEGLVSSLTKKDIQSLKGHNAIGHVRYPTTGESASKNIQPLLSNSVTIAHNGNLTNTKELVQQIGESNFQTTMDSEVILHLLDPHIDLPEALVYALEQVQGAYSLLVMNQDQLIAARDPCGFRPLMYGEYCDKPVFASETCAFDMIGARTIREIQPGEMAIVSKNGIKFRQIFPAERRRCVFELVYFSRPDSKTFGKSVYEIRKSLGKKLAQEQPAFADCVVPVLESGSIPALGYAAESKIPFEYGLIKSQNQRTFIQPEQSLREIGVRLKLNPVKEVVSGKRIVVVDDSIVRSTTIRKIIKMLRDTGAKEIHIRIASPPVIAPCYYGIDMKTREELIAANYSVEDICQYIGADSLGYLSLEGLREVAGEGFCDQCFSGEPVELSNRYQLSMV